MTDTMTASEVTTRPTPFLFRETLWNTHLIELDGRGALFNHILGQWIDEQTKPGPYSLIEIGVWKGDMIGGVRKRFGELIDYIGVDPYGELKDDPYKGQFWDTTAEAEAVMADAKAKFDRCGGALVRTTSDAFFAENDGPFDIVLVDGDHRYAGAKRDLHNALDRLRPGGLLILDDVANNFHPEVEWAARHFVKEREADIDATGIHPLFFRLPEMLFPVVLQFATFRKRRA